MKSSKEIIDEIYNIINHHNTIELFHGKNSTSTAIRVTLVDLIEWIKDEENEE